MFSYNIHWMLSKILQIGKEFFFSFRNGQNKKKPRSQRISKNEENKNLKPVCFLVGVSVNFSLLSSFCSISENEEKKFETKTKPGIGPSIYTHAHIQYENRKGNKERKSSSIIDSSQTHYERINFFFCSSLATVIVNINILDLVLNIKYPLDFLLLFCFKFSNKNNQQIQN